MSLEQAIRYDVEHDLFHPQNIFSDEYITPTFVEYVRKLEAQLEQSKEIIRDLINLTEPTSTEEVQHWNETFRKAEQFLKEVEV